MEGELIVVSTGVTSRCLQSSPPSAPKAHFYGYTVTTRMYIGFSDVFTVTSKGYVRLRSHLGLESEPAGVPIPFPLKEELNQGSLNFEHLNSEP